MNIIPGVGVVFDHIPEVQHKIESYGRAMVRETLERIKNDIESTAPYRGITTAKVKFTALGGSVEVSPWWIGFIELGTVFRGARPFTEPAARKAFALFLPKMKMVESTL